VGRSLCVDLVLSPGLYRAIFLLGKVAVAFLRTGTQKVLSFHSCGSATGIQQFMSGSPFVPELLHTMSHVVSSSCFCKCTEPG